jgi:hypothetical protein
MFSHKYVIPESLVGGSGALGCPPYRAPNTTITDYRYLTVTKARPLADFTRPAMVRCKRSQPKTLMSLIACGERSLTGERFRARRGAFPAPGGSVVVAGKLAPAI